MISNAVVFSEEESQQISDLKASDEFSGGSWSNENLANLKSTIKQHYLTEQNTTCPYCRRNLQTRNGRSWDIEHIIPRSTGKNFMFEPLNLCMACVDCNGEKSAKKVTNSNAQVRYPSQSHSYFFVHPHFDNYKDNILVIRPGFLYIAKSDKGDKTITICGLNRFYSYAGFGKEVDSDERIFLLAESLRATDNVRVKQEIRTQLVEIAVSASI